MKGNKKKYVSPKQDRHRDWKVTDVMTAESYHERLEKELEETLAATVIAETYPRMLNDKAMEDKEDEEE